MEPFKTNPLIAIQHDGDLSRIEDNTRLNSLVAHEEMTVNEKFKSAYTNQFKCFLFIGTNKPVKITDAKSGLIRRLIDISPSGNRLPITEYRRCVKQVKFELGAIAHRCKEVFEGNPGYYDEYLPTVMMGASNDFYNFVLDAYTVFRTEDETSLKVAWEMYKNYCEDANVTYPLPQRVFKEELKNYFKEYFYREYINDGTRPRHVYKGFKKEIFDSDEDKEEPSIDISTEIKLIDFKEQKSIFDTVCLDCQAQYANDDEKPSKKWDDVKTKLSDIDTSKIHYVRIPENHIVIDFDIPNEKGEKDFEANLKAASKWPETYAELSKSGNGIHLHYIYTGDVTRLSRLYADSIEIKVFTGKSSLRRKLTKCNDVEIKTISSGLPLREEKRKVIGENVIKSEKGLRKMIERNMEKEFHPGTKPSVDFIYKILEDAYENGLNYDISDMKNEIYAFAANSTNQSDYCIKLVGKMKFKSDEESEFVDSKSEELVFFDVEVFPNLFLVNWKRQGKDQKIVRMVNPSPTDIEELLNYRLIGFNCRRYDNHMLYARLIGYSVEQIFNLSRRIVNDGDRNAYFREAYNLSYTDIYDFASAANKKSLKKLEIEMGIHHQELGLPWDEPVPEEKWIEVAEYCDNDVIATEAAFSYLSGDWAARQILADLADMNVNATTNNLSTRIIFGGNRTPHSDFMYRNLAEPIKDLDIEVEDFLKDKFPDMMKKGTWKNSKLPYFDGYTYEAGKSLYKNEEVGEGGYVYAEPGIYTNVAILDVASMHPHSIMAECLFGPLFTKRFNELVHGRLLIKHEDWDGINDILDGKLVPYVKKIKNGELKSKDLSNALKTVINSVYGLTAANFDNAFRDIRNKDNIVAKRGALFMTDLKYEVQSRGYTVAHIKTDSIKIPNADQKIIDFVVDFGKKYGYTFEHEATYDRMCLVNDAVFICRYKNEDGSLGKWEATGTQFQIPYVFKTLFSKEQIEFNDLCETKSVTSHLYLDLNEQLPDVSVYEKELTALEKDFKKELVIEQEYIAKRAVLEEKIAEGHDYKFIGKNGTFCPVLPNKGGGLLMREKNGKYYAATGSKGFRWLESDFIRGVDEDIVDRSYYNRLVDDAVDTISKFGDFEWFISDDPIPN